MSPGVCGPLLLPDSFRGRPRFLLGAVNADPNSGLAASGASTLLWPSVCILCRLGGGGGAVGVDDKREDAIEGRSHLQQIYVISILGDKGDLLTMQIRNLKITNLIKIHTSPYSQ